MLKNSIQVNWANKPAEDEDMYLFFIVKNKKNSSPYTSQSPTSPLAVKKKTHIPITKFPAFLLIKMPRFLSFSARWWNVSEP